MNSRFNRLRYQCLVLIVLLLNLGGCDATSNTTALTTNSTPKTQSSAPQVSNTKTQAPRVVVSQGQVHKHNPDFFTQGFLFDNHRILETTGLNGRSRLISYEINGEETTHLTLENRYFGEGLASLGNKLYWLTWKKKTLFVIDKTTMQVTDQLSYKGQGWGLTSDGRHLIKSNGSNELSFHKPTQFKTVKTLHVIDGDKPVTKLNELEWIDGFIYANVWFSDEIVKIDPKNGRVVLRIAVSGIRQQFNIPDRDVLNGIAYNKETGMTLLTGKNWPISVSVKLP